MPTFFCTGNTNRIQTAALPRFCMMVYTCSHARTCAVHNFHVCKVMMQNEATSLTAGRKHYFKNWFAILPSSFRYISTVLLCYVYMSLHGNGISVHGLCFMYLLRSIRGNSLRLMDSNVLRDLTFLRSL